MRTLETSLYIYLLPFPLPGATNRPADLDDAVRRRLSRRVYIPLPEPVTRCALFERLMARHASCLSPAELDELTERTAGYSCSDISQLCKEAAMGPVREVSPVTGKVEGVGGFFGFGGGRGGWWKGSVGVHR